MVDLLEKVPPQALEAEMAVLGAMLIEKEAVAKTLELLDVQSFYREAHRSIFAAIQRLFTEGKAVDVVTVAEALKRERVLTDIGGASYLTHLTSVLPTAANVEHYARLVRAKATLRDLITSATQIVTDCFAEHEDVERLLDRAEQTIFAIAQRKVEQGFVPVSSLVHDVIETVEQLYQRKEHVTGVATGFTDFDVMTAGLQPSNLIIVAGRPAMGKSSWCLNLAAHVGIHSRQPVGLFSLEMSRQEVMLRLLCAEARVDSHKVRRGFLEKKFWNTLTAAASRIAEAPLFIDDTSALTVLEMRARARRLAAELKGQNQSLALIIVDYLQLMRGLGQTENRQQEIAEISRSLKALARDLGIPVIALSQLSRRPEEKGREGRPQLADLRESGALEQDADVVVFIYREEVYKPNDPELAGRAKVIVAKQRNGPTGEFELTFLKHLTRFENPTPITEAV